MSCNFMSCNFMSCNFLPCYFDGPSFSFPSFSAPPVGGGGTDPAQSAVKNIWSKSTISRIGERFRDGQHSLVSFLFLYSRCPRIPRRLK